MQVQTAKQYINWADKKYVDEDGEARAPRPQSFSAHDFSMKQKRYRAARRAAGLSLRQKDEQKRQRLLLEALKIF